MDHNLIEIQTAHTAKMPYRGDRSSTTFGWQACPSRHLASALEQNDVVPGITDRSIALAVANLSKARFLVQSQARDVRTDDMRLQGPIACFFCK